MSKEWIPPARSGRESIAERMSSVSGPVRTRIERYSTGSARCWTLRHVRARRRSVRMFSTSSMMWAMSSLGRSRRGNWNWVFRAENLSTACMIRNLSRIVQLCCGHWGGEVVVAGGGSIRPAPVILPHPATVAGCIRIVGDVASLLLPSTQTRHQKLNKITRVRRKSSWTQHRLQVCSVYPLSSV